MDEATFCHRLKSRIKQHFIPQNDRCMATTNKADGFRLRRHVEARDGAGSTSFL